MAFNNLIKLTQKTQFNILVSGPVLFGDGFISESEEIDFADYKKVERVE